MNADSTVVQEGAQLEPGRPDAVADAAADILTAKYTKKGRLTCQNDFLKYSDCLKGSKTEKIAASLCVSCLFP